MGVIASLFVALKSVSSKNRNGFEFLRTGRSIAFVFCVSVLLTFVTACGQAPVQIVDGKGLGPIALDKSTFADVTAAFGKECRITNHNNYSEQCIYEALGLSFFRRFGSPTNPVFSIKVMPPFKGATQKGIVVGRSSLQDVETKYG